MVFEIRLKIDKSFNKIQINFLHQQYDVFICWYSNKKSKVEYRYVRSADKCPSLLLVQARSVYEIHGNAYLRVPGSIVPRRYILMRYIVNVRYILMNNNTFFVYVRYILMNNDTFFVHVRYILKASVHGGTKVPATWNGNQKLSRIGQIKADIWHF